MARILIVEDDTKTADALCRGLSYEGHEAFWTGTGSAALEAFESTPSDLVILDWMLPDRDGLELLDPFRALRPDVRVLLLTARDALEDRVAGLDSGADDYLIKPFAFVELLARVRALLRRTGASTDGRIQVADLVVDLRTRRAFRHQREIVLTRREFDLLACLARHAGQVVNRRMLAREVWNDPMRVTPIDNLIDVHMVHLRQKVDQGHGQELIRTVRGVGFSLGEDTPR